MIQTITAQNYTKGTENKNGILFVDVNLLNFLNKDGRIVIYFTIGEVIETFDDTLQENVTSYPALSARTISYSDAEIKALIEATGRDFNSPVTNLLIAEIDSFVNDIILDDISNNPNNYFGLTSDKWN
jgi:hypothetical protein